MHSDPQISKVLRTAVCWVLGLLFVLSLATPSQAHWADLAVADIQIRQQNVNISI
jgi:hypothetical protein